MAWVQNDPGHNVSNSHWFAVSRICPLQIFHLTEGHLLSFLARCIEWKACVRIFSDPESGTIWSLAAEFYSLAMVYSFRFLWGLAFNETFIFIFCNYSYFFNNYWFLEVSDIWNFFQDLENLRVQRCMSFTEKIVVCKCSAVKPCIPVK